MATARELFERIDGRLKDSQRQFIRPMATLAVRFSGKALTHTGKTAWSALGVALGRAPPSARWRGMVPNGTKWTRYAAPKPITPAGLKPVHESLAKLKKLPTNAFQLYVTDAPEHLTAERFGLWLNLVKDWQDSFAAPGGLLSVAVPLEEVEALVALGDQLVEVLRAEVAWCGPGVWLAPHCLFNGSSNELPDNAKWLLELFGADPQLDAPHLYASRWPFTANEVEPDLFSGFLAPSWTMWLDAKLAKKITRFPPERTEKRTPFTRYQLSERAPFAMTEALYAQWRAGWAALEPVHLEHQDPSPTAKYFRQRLSAPSLSSLLADWRAEANAQEAARTRAHGLLQEIARAADARSPKLLELAAAARDQVDAGELCWHVLPALVELVPAGEVDPASALVWLDFGEETGAWRSIGNREQLTLDAAALATACNDAPRAFVLIREAFTWNGKLALSSVSKGRLRRDQRFKALRKLPEWKKLVG